MNEIETEKNKKDQWKKELVLRKENLQPLARYNKKKKKKMSHINKIRNEKG